MQLTLGDLRLILLEAFDGSLTLPSDALTLSMVSPSELPQGSSNREVKGTDYFVAFMPRKAFGSGPGYESSLADLAQKHKFTPRDVMKLLKQTSVQAGDVVLKTRPQDQAIAYRRIAARIARRFNDDDIDVIIPVSSNSTMAWELSEHVADLLHAEHGEPLAQVLLGATRKRSAGDMEVDPEAWDAYVAETNPAEVIKTQKLLDKQLAIWKKNPNVEPEMKGVPHSWRKFLHLHDTTDEAGSLRGKNVLVIDDNVDTGFTFVNLRKALSNVGARNVYFAAGYDYKNPNRPKKK